MASNNYNFIMTLVDKVGAPAKKIGGAFKESYENAKKLENSVKRLPVPISGLKRYIEGFDYQRSFAKTEEDVRRLNGKIAETQRELRRLENLPPRGFINRLREIPKALMGVSF